MQASASSAADTISPGGPPPSSSRRRSSTGGHLHGCLTGVHPCLAPAQQLPQHCAEGQGVLTGGCNACSTSGRHRRQQTERQACVC